MELDEFYDCGMGNTRPLFWQNICKIHEPHFLWTLIEQPYSFCDHKFVCCTLHHGYICSTSARACDIISHILCHSTMADVINEFIMHALIHYSTLWVPHGCVPKMFWANWQNWCCVWCRSIQTLVHSDLFHLTHDCQLNALLISYHTFLFLSPCKHQNHQRLEDLQGVPPFK